MCTYSQVVINYSVGDKKATLIVIFFAISPQLIKVEVDATFETASVRINIALFFQRLGSFLHDQS